MFEGIDINIIVVKLNISNNANEKFDTLYDNYFYLVSSTGSYFEELSDYNDTIGDRTCPELGEPIPAGVSKEITLCYMTPKNLLTSFSLKITDSYKEYCDEAQNNEVPNCQEITIAIKNPTKTDYNKYKKKFISVNTDIDAKFKSIDLIEQEGFNILKLILILPICHLRKLIITLKML